VAALRDRAVHWLILEKGVFREQGLPADGVLSSAVFSGLWLDMAAFLRLDRQALAQTLERGLASPEHAAFVQNLRPA
jgi:hypothetical protein